MIQNLVAVIDSGEMAKETMPLTGADIGIPGLLHFYYKSNSRFIEMNPMAPYTHSQEFKRFLLLTPD